MSRSAVTCKLPLASVQSTIDHAIAGLYGVSVSNIERCERVEEGTEPRADFPPQFAFASSDAEALVSYLFGVALGRWTPCIVEHVPSLDESASATPPASSPSPEVLPIVVADAGHRQDIVSLVETALRRILPDVTDGDVVALERALGGSLREWLARTFFTKHIAAYSSFGRSAPVYWQLATPSANYSVWLYLHAFTKDTLYKVQNDYVASKLVHEERKLESLRNELGESPTAAERKTLAAQDTLVDELRAFLDEVKRVAPLWNPTLDDGVIINFSLLWRLVPQNKAWQRELKATWDSLCAGDYDWAHLAMHLWPERVVPKCATDRSLAIAQSLESEFWVKGADGKWKARPMPLRPLEELVRERSSPAVKAALKSLTEAPVARLRGSGRRPRSSAANYANEQI